LFYYCISDTDATDTEKDTQPEKKQDDSEPPHKPDEPEGQPEENQPEGQPEGQPEENPPDNEPEPEADPESQLGTEYTKPKGKNNFNFYVNMYFFVYVDILKYYCHSCSYRYFWSYTL